MNHYQNLGWALPPLQTALQEGKAKECPQACIPSFLVAVTTKAFDSKALLFKPFFLKKHQKNPS